MTVLIHGNDCLEAWKAGAKQVLIDDVFHMVTEVENPVIFHPKWLSQYSPHNAPLSDVINTIFPRKMAARYNGARAEFYERYNAVHGRTARLSGRKRREWGTYFGRLISFGASKSNQLEMLIHVLHSESRHFKVFNPMHISCADMDSMTKRMGNPCLQYVQIVQKDKGVLDMFAVYRNHDFFGKALGNFIGLGLLLQFIADASCRESGKLVCHSAHAYTRKQGDLKKLVDR